MQQFSWAKAKGQHAKWPGDACRWAAAFAVAQPQRLANATGRWALAVHLLSPFLSENLHQLPVMSTTFPSKSRDSGDFSHILKKIPHYTQTNVSVPTPLPLHPTPMSRPVTGNRSDGLKIGKASVGIHKMMCES